MVLTKSLQRLYSMTIDRSKFREVASRIIVFGTPLFFWGKTPNWYGLIFVGLGVLVRGWAAGYLQKDQKLAQHGPYLLVRHPLYLGSVLLSLGFIIALQSWIVLFLIGGVTLLTYFHTIRHEEQNLLRRFGADYAKYRSEAGPLWPYPKGIAKFFKQLFRGPVQYSFKQYLKNREYECMLGVAVVLVFLYVGATRG